MLGTVGGVPILGNAIGDVAIPNVGVGEVIVLFVEIVLPKVAFRANGVGTLELFSMSFDASAAVTLIEIMLSSCSTTAREHLRRLLMLPVKRKKWLVMTSLSIVVGKN